MNSPAAGSSTAVAATARVATPDLIRQIVAEVRERLVGRSLSGPLVIGVRAQPQWHDGIISAEAGPGAGHAGSADGSGDAESITVVPCPSPLAARAALAEFGPWVEEPGGAGDANSGDAGAGGAQPGGTLVLLTDLNEAELGADVLGRLVTPRLFGLNAWDAVCHRFGVRALDPAFDDKRYAWMAEALLAVPVTSASRGGGTLGIETALQIVTEATLGATAVTVERLLVASADSGFASRVAHGDPRTVASLCETLADRLGPAGALVCGLIAKGRGELALPAGLAARTLVGDVAGSYAQAKIADLTGVELPTDKALASWARSAELAFAQLTTSGDPVAGDVAIAGSALVVEWQAPHRGASDVLAVSFEERLDRLAGHLEAILDTATEPDPVSLRLAVRAVLQHREATTPTGRIRAQRAQLAARLAAWLRDPISAEYGVGADADATGVPASLGARTGAYLADGAWVDSARRRVAEGDDTPESFARALRSISEAAHAARALGNESFAGTLARWSAEGTAAELTGTPVVAVERILADVVAPLAGAQPVLLVVLDGCGVPQFLEFAEQFRSLGLREIGRTGLAGAADHNDIGRRLSGLAALPTVTAVSRTSLLSGKLATGGAADERRDLPAHPAIAKLKGAPAVLFHHHPDLVSGSGIGLPQPVKDALSSSGPRVVAAVVNTIDDELARGTFNPQYRLENLGPLTSLLRAAVDAERLVIITADHGHVLGIGLDGQGQVGAGSEGGERWRVADRKPEPGEVLLRGPRVLCGDDRGVLAPWHDDLRYSAKHGGYHGGATPDECIVPLSVFAPIGVDLPKGWDLIAQVAPPWWDLHVDLAGDAGTAPAAEPKRTRPKRGPKPVTGETSLFPELDLSGDGSSGAGGSGPGGAAAGGATAGGSPAGGAPAAAPWLDDLIGSQNYALQLGAITRSKPKEPDVRAALGALHTRGGVASFGVIAQATGMPLSRMSGFLATLARLLNVDGYGVLDVDPSAQEARLDEGLLADQFLGGPVNGGGS